MNLPLSPVRGLACLSLLLLAVARPAPAATFTWTGGGSDANFTTAGDWSGGVAPSPTTTSAYDFGGAVRLSPQIVVSGTGDWQASSVTFDTTAGSFNVLGGPDATTERLKLSAGGFIEQDSANNQTISAFVLLGSVGTYTIQGSGAGALTLAGISDGGATASTILVNHNTTFGVYRGSVASSNGTAMKVGSGVTLTFSATGTKYTSSSPSNFDLPNLVLNEAGGADAVVQASNAGGFSTAAAVQANNTTFAGSRAMTFSGNYTQLGSGNETVTFTNTGGTTLSGTTVQLGAADGASSRTVTLGIGTGTNATISGSVTGSASTGTTGITKSGAGTLVLSGTGSITGAVGLSQGKTLFNGTFTGGAVIVASGATLSGSGTLGTLAGNSISVSGTVAPGDVGTVSTLHLALNSGDKLSFASGSTLAFDVGTSTSDQIAFGTAGDWLSGSGDLTLALSGTINYGATYTVFSNVTTSGFALAGVTGLDGAHAAVFSQNGTLYQLSFNSVPEPSAAWLLPVGGLALLARRRRPAARSRSS